MAEFVEEPEADAYNGSFGVLRGVLCLADAVPATWIL